MELWIRSQDKELLILAEHLDIYNVSVDCELYSIEESGVDIGIYSTKKRALEVLDEIQSKMREQFIVKSNALMSLADVDKEESRLNWKYAKEFIMQDSGFQIEPINTGIIVYEMPEK